MEFQRMENMSDPRKLDFIEDFDKEASKFLEHYGYESLIDHPAPIPIRDIAMKKMMLDIVDTMYLSPDSSVHGIITFADGMIDVYDWQNEEYVGYTANRGTIFIETDINNKGRFNNILTHECFHWYKHRLYFMYHSMDGKNVGFAFRCNQKVESDVKKDSWSDIDKMEYQAKMMAPKILMPKIATKIKIEELIQKNKQSYSTEVPIGMYERVIAQVADFFQVSKQAAAIRMCELGYEEAKPYCASNLFEKVYTHLSVKATIGQQRQQEISLNEAFEEFCKNKFFTIMLATGSYRYTEGYFVLNDEKYYDANTNSMTQYAKSHLAECTIDFSYRYVRKDQGDHIGSHMFHKNVEYKRIPSFDVSAQNTDSYNHARALENIRKKFDEEYELESKIHESTTQKFWKIMQLKKWNTSIFQDKTWLSPMDYTRVQDPKHIFKLPAYTAMAVGLGLSLSITEEILRASGLAYNMGDRTHKAYAFVLSSFQGCSLEECNEVLKALGVKELGTKSRK